MVIARKTRLLSKTSYQHACTIASIILTETFIKADLDLLITTSVEILFTKHQNFSGSYDIQNKQILLSSRLRDVFDMIASGRRVPSKEVSKAMFVTLHECWHAAQFNSDKDRSHHLCKPSYKDVPSIARPKLRALTQESTINYFHQMRRQGKSITQIELDNLYQKELAANLYAYNNTREVSLKLNYLAGGDEFLSNLEKDIPSLSKDYLRIVSQLASR